MSVAGALPRYFVARSGAPEFSSAEPAPILQIIDSFIIGGRHIHEMDCVVGVDAGGDLQLTGMAIAREMDELLQGQLAYNELSATDGRRIMSVNRLYLFALQLLEQPGDSPGINDPVYLYGKLFGVYPEAPNSVGIEGQLTVTRADILNGIASGDKYGFTYAVGTNHSTLPTRCHHFMVPGDNDVEVGRGAGVVLVYPLPTAELAANDPSNELTTKQILFDVLQSLKKDIEKNNVRSKLSKIELPVPSRQALIQNLEMRGYAIKGNTAVRKLPVKGVGDPIVDGVLEHLYGKITKDKLELPPEGTMSDFVEIARQVMQSTQGWPPERCQLISRLSRTATAEEIARASQHVDPNPGRVAKTPQRPGAGAASASKSDFGPTQQQELERIRQNALKSARAANQGPPSWTKDFTQAHKSNSPPTLTPTTFAGSGTAGTAPPASGQSGKPQERPSENKKPATQKPDWMNDFGADKEEIKHHKTKPDENETKPDWMGDFQ